MLSGGEPAKQTIDITPDPAGLRAWCLRVAETDPKVALDIAVAMGEQAPTLAEIADAANGRKVPPC